MQFVKEKPPEIHYATCPGARAKRRGVALGRPGFKPGRLCAWLSFRSLEYALIQQATPHQRNYVHQYGVMQARIDMFVQAVLMERELMAARDGACKRPSFQVSIRYGPVSRACTYVSAVCCKLTSHGAGVRIHACGFGVLTCG
jgi:hypothetical protein